MCRVKSCVLRSMRWSSCLGRVEVVVELWSPVSDDGDAREDRTAECVLRQDTPVIEEQEDSA